MAKLINRCSVCGRIAEEKSSTPIPAFGIRMVYLTCGHSYQEKILPKQPWEEIETQFGAKVKLYPYQGLGYEFARESGFRCLIGDEPGLGKTFQANTCLKLHPDELLPALIICKAALKLQQFKEILRLCGAEYMPQIIQDSKEKPNKMFLIVIVTYDMLWRITKRQMAISEKAEAEVRTRLGLDEWDIIPEEERKNIPEVISPFTEFGFKTVILDECQQIKNPTSKRTQQVQNVCRNIPHVIATSGSPIENHAGEYFPILNILRPSRFPFYKHYLDNYCDYYFNGRGYKVGGLKDIQWFKSNTDDFIIRRKKADVLPDLPKKERKFISCEFASDKIRSDYEDMAEDFSDYYNEHEGEQDFAQGILAKMAKLRHKAGQNKVPFASEFIEDFVLDTSKDRKLVVFVEHQDVGLMLFQSLSMRFAKLRTEGIEIDDPLTYTADLNSERRNSVREEFQRNDRVRVLIASTKAAGEGLDGLQRVSQDCIILERQWNPKKEEQAEDRLERIGSMSKDGSITCNYILTAGTIDEYMTELIEIKRANTDQTLDGIEYVWDESSLMKELAAILARKGKKKWHLT